MVNDPHDDTQEPFPSLVRTAVPANVHYVLASSQREDQAIEKLRRIVYAEPGTMIAEVSAARKWLLQFGDVEQSVLGS